MSGNRLTLHEAAVALATEPGQVRDAEIRLAHAIEHGDLHADVVRWATEQWEGNHLPGNLNARMTRIAAADFAEWQARQGAR
jgi:hypothetical protein